MLTLQLLAFYVIKFYNVSLEDFKSKNQKHRLVYVRQVFSYLAAQEGYTVVEIGEYLNRDHSTITAQKRRIEGFLAYETKLQETISIISQRLKEERYKKLIANF